MHAHASSPYRMWKPRCGNVDREWWWKYTIPNLWVYMWTNAECQIQTPAYSETKVAKKEKWLLLLMLLLSSPPPPPLLLLLMCCFCLLIFFTILVETHFNIQYYIIHTSLALSERKTPCVCVPALVYVCMLLWHGMAWHSVCMCGRIHNKCV